MSQSADTSDRPRTSSTSVVYRHVTLIDGAELKVHEDRSVFVAMEEPPPIRTVVQLWRADQARAVMVGRIVEVPENDPAGARGFYGITADETAIAAARSVGTERLESGDPHAFHGTADSGSSDSDPDANYNMAMPAPVVGDIEDEPEPESSGSGEGDGEGDGEGGGESDAESADGSGRKKRARKKKR